MYYWHWWKNLVHRPYTTRFPDEMDPDVEINHSAIRPVMDRFEPLPSGPRSAALRHLDAGSCNGCESELSLLTGPNYDFTRYGLSYTPSPKHADILLVTGVITQAMVPVIHEVWEQMPDPKRVVAIGECAISGGVFSEATNVLGSLAGIVPVTLEVDGCPPSPADILRGLLWAVDGKDPIREISRKGSEL